ncbi:hypothetical protein [Cellulomonas endophytica]|uniref:hypothetical protein n=1 Tax=Cellulomonas endophytica TaxID=2494735 RepID=UPI0010113170|nr:hypothetical protein [Cellulomonas endophytica]
MTVRRLAALLLAVAPALVALAAPALAAPAGAAGAPSAVVHPAVADAEEDGPRVAADGAAGWVAEGYYLVRATGSVWYVDPAADAAYTLTFQEWAEDGFPAPQPAPTDYVRYPWSPGISAVTFFGPERDQWAWDHLDLGQWLRAGAPAPRSAGWVEGSDFYTFGQVWTIHGWAPAEGFVQDPSGVRHKLTLAQWRDAGEPDLRLRHDRVVQVGWGGVALPELLLVDGAGHRVMTWTDWAAEDFPRPTREGRVPGDSVWRHAGLPVIYYSNAARTVPLEHLHWVFFLGSPAPEVR